MSPFAVLGVPETASLSAIKKAYTQKIGPFLLHGSQESGRIKELNDALKAAIRASRAQRGVILTMADGRKITPWKLSPSGIGVEIARAKRAIVKERMDLERIAATVVTWRPDDFRILLMRKPHEEEIAKLEALIESLEYYA